MPQHAGNGICCHLHIFFQICNPDTREDARTYMTGFLHNLNLASFLPDPFENFGPSPSVCFAFDWDAGAGDRPIVRFSFVSSSFLVIQFCN